MLMCLVSWSVFAQEEEPASPYVLDQFVAGKVYMHSGEVVPKQLNYNGVTQEMVFEESGSMLALKYPEKVDSVVLGKRLFVNEKGAFYERVGVWQEGLFVLYHYRVIPPSSNAGYGSDGSVTSSTNLSSLSGRTMMYQLKLPENYRIVPSSECYLKTKGAFHRLHQIAVLAELFPEKKAALKEFARQQHLKMNEVDDVKRLVEFCSK